MGGDHVSTVGHTGIQHDGGVVAEFSSDFRQHVKWYRSSVQLATAMVGQHNAINTEIYHPLRISQRLYTFDHNIARPHLTNNFQILDRKSTRLNSSHVAISYAVFCLKKKNKTR